MLEFNEVEFDYKPYPIGLASNVIARDVYTEMLQTFPDLEEFKKARSVKGLKFQLSRRNHRLRYLAHVRKHAVWKGFYEYIKSDAFPRAVFDMLEERCIDLGLRKPDLLNRLDLRYKAWRKGSPQPRFPNLSCRFEFMTMPVAGGCIPPHTDHPSKRVTLVVSMVGPDEWNPEHGGGTSVVWPKETKRSFNYMNRYLKFDEVEAVRTFPFRENQAVVFLKTYDSWHAVWPMTGKDPHALRRTVVINIESS